MPPGTAGPPDFDKGYRDLMSGDAEAVSEAAGLVKKQHEDTRQLYVDRLLRDLRAPDPKRRYGTAWALEDIGTAEAVEALIDALQSEDIRHMDVCTSAAFALGQIGEATAPAVPALIARLKDDGEHVRFRAAEALGNIGDVGAVEPLIEALKDDDETVREAAAEALGKIGTPEALEALKEHGYDVPSDEVPHDAPQG